MSHHPGIPAAIDAPEGMHVLYADRDDSRRLSYFRDVPYCVRDGQILTMQLIFPVFPVGMMPEVPPDYVNPKLPLVVFIQGSGWRKQNVYWSLPNLVDLAREGFVVASVEYRASDDAPWPAFLQDVAARTPHGTLPPQVPAISRTPHGPSSR